MAVCGSLSFILLTELEEETGHEYYSVVSRQAIELTVDNLDRIVSVGNALAVDYAYSYPYAVEWPNVVLQSYPPVAKSLTLGSTAHVFNQLVQPEQLNAFEEFYYNYYASDPSFYDGIGQHSFGEGVFSFNRSLNNSDKRYHDTTGVVDGSPYNVLTPIVQYSDMTNFISAPGIMFNIHRLNGFTSPIDAMITCANAAKESDQTNNRFPACRASTDILPVIVGTATDVDFDPKITDVQFAVFEPVYPAHNATTIVGFSSSVVSMSDLLLLAVPSYINGIDVVFSSETVQYTYSISNGKPTFRGEGDRHETEFTSWGISRTLFKGEAGTPTLKVSIYPSSEYYESYSTNLPVYACVGSVSLILFCGLLFGVYDYLMRWEYNNAQAVLETKRRYVRFISHEVRTPLNIIKLGIEVIELEINKITSTLTVLNSTVERLKTVRDADCKDLVQCVTRLNSALSDVVLVMNDTTEEIKSNTESAVEVLTDLINYDKVESGTLRLEWSEVDIWTTVETIVKATHTQVEAAQLNLELQGDAWPAALNNRDDACDCPEQLECGTNGKCPSDVRSLCVIGDSQRLAQVLRNLISNAVKFTPAGGSISIRADWMRAGLSSADLSRVDPESEYEGWNSTAGRPRAGVVRISVSDNGAGLTAVQLKELFGEGVQFNANTLQAGQGSGLGLFIARGMIVQHGGTLTATSEGLGQGSTFTVMLPMFVRQPDRSAAAATATTFTESQQQQSKIRDDANLQPLVGVTEHIAPRANALPEPQPMELQYPSAYSSSSSQRSSLPSSSSPPLPVITNHAPPASSVKPKEPRDKAKGEDDNPPVGVVSTVTSGVSVTDAVSQGAEQPPHTPEPLQPSPRRVLMVDDSLPNRKILGRLLRSHGYEVTEAVDGQDAVNKVKAALDVVATHPLDQKQQQHTSIRVPTAIDSAVSAGAGAGVSLREPSLVSSPVFDMITMDFEMPVMNGPDATRAIRQLGFKGPIVGVSGNVLSDDVAHFKACGANAVLAKPLHLEQLEELW